VSQVFNINLQGSRLRGRPKTDGGFVYKQILIDANLKPVQRSQKSRAYWEEAIKEAKFRIGL